MNHPIVQAVIDMQQEDDLLEKMLGEVVENDIDKARLTAARIIALRDIIFNLNKVMKDNDDNSGIHS